jgi:cutinase
MCKHAVMNAGKVVRILGVAAVTTWGLLSPVIDPPSASADQCPDSEVVFARGTGEPPGVGGVGQAFIDSLQSQDPGQTIAVYPVNYPATDDYRNSAEAGADDARAHVLSMVANCPNTRMVLGGYSQGAVVTDLVTDSVPPQTANHVAAVALFGNPTSSYSASLFGAPLPTLNPAYRPETIDLCVPNDIICAEGGNMAAHLMYVPGMSDQAATFVANRLRTSPAPAQRA